MSKTLLILAVATAAAVAGNVYVCDYEYQAGWDGASKWQMRLH